MNKSIREIEYWPNGNIRSEAYLVNGELHRAGNPAYLLYRETGSLVVEIYYVDGKRHRNNGPASIWYDEKGNIIDATYYIKGNIVSKGKFIQLKMNKTLNSKSHNIGL